MGAEQLVDLSRLQFAATAMYHFLFVPLALGMVWLLVIMESVYVMTGKAVYRDMTRFWGRLFGINFALGVTTGNTLEFQFGTNRPYCSFRIAAAFGLASACSVIVLGDESGYTVGAIDTAGAANPMAKEVTRAAGAWLANYRSHPLTLLVPATAYAGAIGALLSARVGATLRALALSSLAMAGVIGTAGVSMFPFVMPSSTDPRASLTVWDSVSSHLTLAIMFWATLVFLPLVIGYTAWAYRVMAGKVTADYVRENSHLAY